MTIGGVRVSVSYGCMLLTSGRLRFVVCLHVSSRYSCGTALRPIVGLRLPLVAIATSDALCDALVAGCSKLGRFSNALYVVAFCIGGQVTGNDGVPAGGSVKSVRHFLVCGIGPPSSGIPLRRKEELRRERIPLAGFAMCAAMGNVLLVVVVWMGSAVCLGR